MADVLVLGGGVAQPLVKPDGVVKGAGPVQFGLQFAGVFDLFQVRVFVLDVPNRDSIQAWSFGVPGRPKCCPILTEARNAAVALEVICGPLSLIASSTGSSFAVRDDAVGQLGAQQVVDQVVLAVGDQGLGKATSTWVEDSSGTRR